MKAITNVLTQLRVDRPQTDGLDAWNHLKYIGFKRLNLTEEEKEELRSYGNEIRE